jgi:membrane associated rhomboid family serine protease
MSLPQPPAPSTTRCYRHPEREAGRRCTRCGRPACSECLVQAAVGSHCLECAKAAKPSVATRARYFSARQPILVTYVLMAINIGLFIAVTIAEPRSLTSGRISGAAEGEFGQFDLVVAGPLLEQGEWYRMVTAGFVHFGIIHLAFNMLLLFQLGLLLEPAIGRVRYALLYFAALLAGSAGAVLLDPNALTGGASGAVFGLMGAAFIGLRHRGINPLSTSIGSVLILNLLITFTLPGISIGGHLGGVLGGAVAGWVILAPAYRGIPTWATYATPVAIMVVSLAVTWIVVQ